MSERDELIECLRYRPVATTAAQMREAADLLERDGARAAAAENELDAARAENARLISCYMADLHRNAMKRQASAALTMRAESQPELIESERAANARLTEELDAARAALAEAQEELRVCQQDAIRLQSALAEARESVAQWMIAQGFATGHGDTIKDLLGEITWQVREIRERAKEMSHPCGARDDCTGTEDWSTGTGGEP